MKWDSVITLWIPGQARNDKIKNYENFILGFISVFIFSFHC